MVRRMRFDLELIFKKIADQGGAKGYMPIVQVEEVDRLFFDAQIFKGGAGKVE